MALVVAATTIFSGCAGILVCTGYPGIGPDRDFKLDMTRAEVEEKLGFPYGSQKPFARQELPQWRGAP